MADANPRAVIGNNRSPFELIRDEILDLFAEARHWADGEPITSQEQADAVTRLHDSLSEAGKRAEAARVEEKKPLDEAVKDIQDRYNALIGSTKSAKGKVPLGKESLAALLTPWRERLVREREEAARLAREEADRLAAEATAAMRASAGNLEEREKAEELLAAAKATERDAKRQDKAATTGTGLRTVWIAKLVDEGAALDWAYGRDPDAFKQLVQSMADGVVRGGMRTVPGFEVTSERVAR